MAQRIQHKRSSIAGKRPDNSYLEPGELVLNTNADDPGVYFEVNDGSVVKAGPTYIGESQPPTNIPYGSGESWYDLGNGTFNIYSAESEKWLQAYSAPYGGSIRLLYVGTQFPEASDDLSNDGLARPFSTLNRACIEIVRRTILQNREDDTFAEQFVIMLLPGTNIVYNEPGLSKLEFENDVPSFTENQVITPEILRAFNSETGGLILPRGASITSFDTKKTLIRPTYYPHWSRFDYTEYPDTLSPRSNILKWTGGSSVSQVTFRDKRNLISVTEITGEADQPAVLHSLSPHGFRSFISSVNSDKEVVYVGDEVQLNYPDQVSRAYEGQNSVAEGKYFVEPLSATTFRLLEVTTKMPILRNQLPFAPEPGTQPQEFLDLSYKNTTHHRLTAIGYATETELQRFYSKVQRAYSEIYFGGRINDSNVASSEIDIVIPLPEVSSPSLNDVTHTAPRVYNCELRSNYGMNGLTCDGSLVGGTKSLSATDFKYLAMQNDPDVYEVYYDGVWLSLKEVTARSNNIPLEKVTEEMSLEFRVSNVELANLRKFFRSTPDIPSSSNDHSSGLPYDLSDTRNYSVLATNSGVVQATTCSSLGAEVHFWSRSGGRLFSSNCSTALGGQSLRSEGFSGIGTGGGSEDRDKGFQVKGLRRPSNVHHSELSNSSNYRYLYLNGNIVSKTSTTIKMSEPIDTRGLFPYTLKPGTVIWVSEITTNSNLKATLGSNPLSEDNLTLTLESENNEIFSANLDDLSPPFIRRFVDPRPESHRSYSLWIENTTPGHRPPSPGSMVRYAELSLSKVQPLLRPGKQLDPGQNGGWNHMFAVEEAFTVRDGNNPNVAFPPSSVPNPSDGYYVSLRLCDSFSPWQKSLMYDSGAYSTYLQKPYEAEYSEENSVYEVLPTEETSVFVQSRVYDFCQPFKEAYVGESRYTNIEDPNEDEYVDGDTYLRGVSPSTSNYLSAVTIDYDDGSTNLGLKGTGEYSNFVNPTYIDPYWSHTKLAMKRFLTLLGYESEGIDNILKPQRWSNRSLPVSSFPELGDKGYALSEGDWPIEFNLPSLVNSSGHQWESPGYEDYSKGLERYRQVPLSYRMRFDNVLDEVWGGIVIAQGLTDSGEFVVSRLASVGSGGRSTRTQLNAGDSMTIKGSFTPSVF
jgi:hypothetical protein